MSGNAKKMRVYRRTTHIPADVVVIGEIPKRAERLSKLESPSASGAAGTVR